MSKKVLVVDDEECLVELIRINLAAKGFDVITAPDGKTALEKAAGEMPDLIILDVMLPDIKGWEVCRKIKSDPKTRDIKIIFLTASAQKKDIERAKESGGSFFIPKPFDPLELAGIVEQILNGGALW